MECSHSLFVLLYRYVGRTKEDEEKRVNKELANVRSKFKEAGLNSYQKKKYICKLMYIFLLGYEVDFGQVEAVNLINDPKFSEKQVGYLATSLLLNENNEMVRLLINSMSKDLKDMNETVNCLALQAVANLANKEVAEALITDVYRLLNPKNNPFVRKKAALCLLRLYRKSPDTVPVVDWADTIIATVEDNDVGVCLSGCSLVMALAIDQPKVFAKCTPVVVEKLYSIVIDKLFTPDNVYYHVPVPWLQIKLCKLLQVFDPPADENIRQKVLLCIRQMFENANEVPKNAQHNNALTAVVTEAVRLCLHIDQNCDLVPMAVNLAARYVVSKETNMKYIGLELMALLASYDQCVEIIKKHREGILVTLNDRDVSIRRRAMDLLFVMCDREIAHQVVEELLMNLPNADYSMKEDMVLKIAILTEKFAEDLTWYLDVSLKLLDMAGEHCSSEVWHRIAQMVTNNQTIHAKTANDMFNLLKNPTCNENVIKLAAYVLGEYGDLIASEPASDPIHQFMELKSKFLSVSSSARCMILTAFVKFVNIFPEIKEHCVQFFESHKYSLDVELQQRALEYLALSTMPTDDLIQVIFEQMPVFGERESALVGRLNKKDEVSGKNIASGHRKRVVNATEGKTAVPANTDALISLDYDQSFPVKTFSMPEPASKEKVQALFLAFVEKTGGILYEDSAIQIGVKSEFRGAAGKIAFFIGNKTEVAFNSFDYSIDAVAGVSVRLGDKISQVPAKAQVQQAMAIECSGPFALPPVLNISYSLDNHSIRIPPLLLPTPLSKFMETMIMNATDFVTRWKALGATKETQEIINYGKPFSIERVKEILAGLKLAAFDGVDPNVQNIVSACVLQTSAAKIGFMLRLECNAEHKMFRATVRSTTDNTSKIFAGYLKEFLLRLLQ